MLTRLTTFDRWLVLIGVPIWALCFGLSVHAVWQGAGRTSVHITAFPAADAYPQVTNLARFVSFDGADLRLGDEVLRVGDVDLKGMGPLSFYVHFSAEALGSEHVSLRRRRDGQEATLAVPAIQLSDFAWFLAISPLLLVFGVAIVLRAPRARLSRAVGQFMLVSAIATPAFLIGTGGITTWASLVLMGVTHPLAFALGVRALQLFPAGTPPRTLRGRLAPLPFALMGASQPIMVTGIPFSGPWLSYVGTWLMGVMLVLLLAKLAAMYHDLDPVGRRKLKVAILGLYASILPSALAYVWVAFHLEDVLLTTLSGYTLAAAPFFVYLALYRWDLFDVDRVLSATASYNLVIFALVGLGLVLVPRIGAATASLVGASAESGQLLFGLALAAMVIPAHRVLRPRLEQALFRERHAIKEGLERLRSELSSAPNPEALLKQVGEGLHALLRPVSTVLYAGDEEGYAALLVAGRAVAPALDPEGPVVHILRERRSVLCIDGTGSDDDDLDAFARATLETLNAAVVLPLSTTEGDLEAVLCLGPKRSQDLYTPSELARLESIADRAALVLQRFDRDERARQEHGMQEALRRYVPGAIAEEIERGREVGSEEREVTVLFVDIRGYTALSEGQKAETIFSTVNGYTEQVSRIVRAEGGAVVEFNGDGMMAVFGAPETLPARERAAVRAGRAIVDEVGSLELDGRALAVGVGVASGNAFVGNIQAADRLIWSAIGETTNLAARLQALTRDLDALMLIDAPTFAALGRAEAAGFETHEQIEVRGRSRRIDVHALPGEARAAPPSLVSRETEAAEFRLSGKVWTVAYAGRRVDLPDAKGLHYLRQLLAQPQEEIHVGDLVTAVEGVPAAAASAGAAAEDGLVGAGGSGDEILDPTARAAYRDRLAELREDLEEAEARNDLGASERAREEMDFLERELSAGVGLGGRARQTGSDAERARKAVYNRIQASLKSLREIHPELAAHLDAAVRTGATCAYRPEHAPAWQLD